MDKHYIFNIGYLTHTPFPEIALGLLFLVATVILIYKFVSMVKTGKSSPKEISSAQDKNTAVEKEAAPYQFIDLRKKIEGFWRGYAGGSSLNIHVFSWGDSFLMDMTSEELGIKHQYYVFSGTLSDDYKFYAEGCETYTFLFNAEMDTLFFAEKGLFLNRVSEYEITIENKMKEVVDKALDVSLKDVKFKENETD